MRTKGNKEVEQLANQLEVLKIEYVLPEELAPNRYNPNRQSDHEFKMLIDSMLTNGFTQPILAQKKTKEIVDGEHRWRAVREIVNKKINPKLFPADFKIPVVFVDMTEEQRRIATLSHNRARGNEDVGLTAELLRDLERMGALSFAQDQLGLDDVEIQRLINDIPAPEALATLEFSQPWTPDGINQNNKADTVSMTQEASDRLRVVQDKIDRAKTEQDRDAARKDSQIYTMNLIYTGEEAEVVKKVLGSRPAPLILKWCRERANSGEAA